MFCEACGARLNEGARACTGCGTEVPAVGDTLLRPPARQVAPAPPPSFEAACAAHPATRATFVCARCGTFSCQACAATAPGSGAFCFRCAASGGTLATRGARFVANLVDNFVVVIPVVAAFGLAAVLLAANDGKKLEGMEALIILGGMGGLMVGCAIQIAAQVNWGQSIGKRMMGIKVVRLNGQPIELWRLLLMRNLLVHVIAQLCGLVGLVDALMIYGDQQRCLHDHLADSMVVVATKD